ncbi:AcrR family transcriptional regulator [Methylopila capsulata]|uniref:AcrR family transcriptional regulator n=1 Tax=Methylopila capsulata TaxID=61654 RepID=A0A9W6MTA0_9HYPH|nr:TetR/AcrR family transcriptional regulator [Methylopila capsulata]MBM7852668.1 AcrR family transcriptional regulator [Methylopila capsulata]GLK56876.1 TetR family transcriptional regulator [Methylopila capsulata]
MPDAAPAPSTDRTARGRPRTPSGERRARIVAAARAIFVDAGYGAMTTNAVAARCQVSKRTIYEQFANKAELFGAIVDSHRPEMLRLPPADAGMSLEDALAEIFRLDIDEDSDRIRNAFIRAALKDGDAFPEVHHLVVAKGVEPSRRALAEWLDERRREGRLAFADAEQTARLLMDLIFASAGAAAFRPGPWPDLASRAAHQRYCISVFLNGVRPRGRDGAAQESAV